jgi:chromosome segregation ATPase
MADDSSEENEEEEDELQMLREEVSSLETLVDESAEVIGVLRQKYNEEKSDNSILAQKLMTLEAENEFYRRENESLEKANKRLQNEVKAMEHEIKLEDDVQRTLSETTHIAELNKLIDANNDIMVGADSRSNFFDEYQDYVQRLVDIDGSTGPDLFEEILSSLR